MFRRRLRNGNSNTKNKQITQINRRIESLQQNADLSIQEKQKQNEFEQAKALAKKAKNKKNKTNKNTIVSNLERQLAVIRGQRRGYENPELEIEKLKKQKQEVAATLEAANTTHTSILKQKIKQIESIKALGLANLKGLGNINENDLKEALKIVQDIKSKYVANIQYSEPVKGQKGQNLNIRTINGQQRLVARTKTNNFTKPGPNVSLINRKTGNIKKTKEEMMAEMLARYEKDLVTSSVKPNQNPAASQIKFSQLPKEQQIEYIKKQITKVQNWDIATGTDSYRQAEVVEKLQKQLAALQKAVSSVAPPILRAPRPTPPQNLVKT
jgi:hypothetical protein